MHLLERLASLQLIWLKQQKFRLQNSQSVIRKLHLPQPRPTLPILQQEAAPVGVTVETEGAVPPEVANAVVENATIALADVEKAKEGAEEVIEEAIATDTTQTPAEVFCYSRVLLGPRRCAQSE